MFKKFLIAALITLLPVLAFGQVTDDGKPVKVITDISISGVTYWHADTVYNLDGLVFVEDGEVLIIEPGTIIKGNTGQGTDASTLVVARGGKILAEGTQAEPIVFTTILDDVDNPTDIPLDTINAVGKWGGVILLGRAHINTASGVGQIEGIDPLEIRGAYGGTDDDDNSGVLKYVSIRHGGTEIGAANEINGLTMGAVGRGTTISHVEVFYNLDDGFEWFGGTVNCDHLVAAFCGDDAFDYDEGWRGAGQFWFSIQRPDKGDRGGEHDGGTSPVDGEAFATPLISNATYFGRGAANGAQRCFEIRDNAGGGYMNSIFYDHGTYGIRVETSAGEPTDSKTRLLEGQIYFRNNIWYNFGNGNTVADITNGDTDIEAALFTSGNDFASDPGINNVSRTNDGTLDPRPSTVGTTGWTSWIDPNDPTDGYNPPVATGYPASIDINFPEFKMVDYPGAFDPNTSMDNAWTSGWSILHCNGFIGDFSGGGCCLGSTGNVNDDPLVNDILDISDLLYLVDYFFLAGSPGPICPEEADVNASGLLDISDLLFLVDFFFAPGSPAPAACQ